jgi:hypothetical protein
MESPGECQLREQQVPYNAISGHENGHLSSPNLYLWDLYPFNPDG